MTYAQTVTARPRFTSLLLSFLQAFPIACFTLTVFTDAAYLQTFNLLWLHFSEWLLFAGLVFGALALIVRLIGAIFGKMRLSWPAIVGGVVVLFLAMLNSFVHTADGWTAVYPYGVTLSIATVLAIIATGWLNWRTANHV